MRILLWHVHGSWTTSFVQGRHEYLLPLTPDRDRDGLGRATSWDWPASVEEVPVDGLTDADFDLVVLQRPHEPDLVRRWTGRTPGRDVPAVYVEHNTPGGDVPFTRHPLADRSDIPVVHVTHFNRLFWDCGRAPVDVIEHGIVDPGHRYSGEWARAAVVVNDPVRRGRARRDGGGCRGAARGRRAHHPAGRAGRRGVAVRARSRGGPPGRRRGPAD